MSVKVGIKFLPHAISTELPAYQSEGAAGFDLVAAIPVSRVLNHHDRMVIPTGISFELPEGWEAQIRSRSGLAAGQGMFVLNSPGTIDADYRGEILVILQNLGPTSYTIRPGDRIAQAVIMPIYRAELVAVEEVTKTKRGSGGLGSTGK